MSVVEETFSSPPRFLVGNPSPLLIHWMYQAASVYSRLLRVTENEDSGLLENLKLQLRTSRRRWMVAGSFFSSAGLRTGLTCFQGRTCRSWKQEKS